MRVFDKTEFELGSFTTLLGEDYDNYWIQSFKHKSGNVVDILVNSFDEVVSEPDDITDKIKVNFYHDGQHPKVIPIKIGDKKCLVIKFPTIKI